MKAELKTTRGEGLLLYELSAVIESRLFVVKHRIDDAAYRYLDVKDARELIERGLWTGLMRAIEHELKKGVNAQT